MAGSKRIIAVGDIHGCINELLLMLEKVNYDKQKDQLIFLGDYVDKGPNPKLVLEKIMDLVLNDDAIALGGNHEQIFLNWLCNNDYKRTPYFHRKVGGRKTVASFYPFSLETLDDEARAREHILNHYRHVIDFIKSRPNFYESDKHIFVHAGINPQASPWQNTSEHDFRWIRELFLHEPNHVNKKIVFGHTVTYKLHKRDFFYDAWIHENKIGIDGGCVYGGNLIALEINDTEQLFHYVRKTDLRNEVD